VGLYGSADEKQVFRRCAPHVEILAEGDEAMLDRLPSLPVWVIANEDANKRDGVAAILAQEMPAPVTLFPSELIAVDNPAVADRSAFGMFR
jgi:negative regulator of replication initiation